MASDGFAPRFKRVVLIDLRHVFGLDGPAIVPQARKLAADCVALHAAWVSCRHQLPGFRIPAGDGQPAERPWSVEDEIVTPVPEGLDRCRIVPVCANQPARMRLVWIEGAREVAAVEHRGVDRFLQVEAKDGMGEKEVERPLVLLIAARCAEGEPWLSLPKYEGRAQSRSRPFPALQRVGMPFVEVEHLRPRPQAEAEPRNRG